MTDDTHSNGDPDVTAGESSETDASGDPEFDFDVDDFDRRAEIEPGEVERVFSVLETAVTDGELEEDEIEGLLRVLETAIVSPIPIQSKEIDELLSILESTLEGSPGGQTATEVLTVLESAILDPARLQTTESDGILSVLESAIVGPANRGTGVEDIFSLVDSFADPDRDSEERGLFSLFDPMNLSGRGRGSRRGERGERGEPGEYGEPLAPEGEDTIADPFRIARIAAATTQRATDYSLRSGIRTGTRMVKAASTAGSLEELIEDGREIAFDEMERLGFDIGERGSGRERDGWAEDDRIQTEEVLKERGARLLEKSADIDHDDPIHPAFPNIVNQLAADEARILRFLATEGPQPAVNIRDVGWVPLSSKLKAAGLSMIGTESGCRHDDRTPAYLNNLNRLGLVWFSDEPVDNIKRYQVVEAQPPVEAAINDCKRPKVIRRSIHLTPFGVDFCRVCLPIDVISEDASSVYDPPKDRTNQRDAEADRSETRPARRGRPQSGQDSIRNPHRDDR
jgi:hypothetical protein